MNNQQKGFSLIELLIVMSIMGLLGSFIYPNFTKIQDKAKEAALKSSCHTIQLAIESYVLANGSFPSGQNIDGAALIQTLIQNGDLAKSPTNPFTKAAFSSSDNSGKLSYSYTDHTDTYTLTALGKGNAGTVLTLSNK